MYESVQRILINGALDYRDAMSELSRPSILLQKSLKVFIDGDQWCALWGENLQEGIAGFGDSPEKAMRDFDAAMQKDLKAKEEGEK